MRDLTRFFEKFEKNKKGVGEMSGLDCKARHSRMMRVGRRVQNWEIDRALNEASRGALAPGPAQPVDARRTMGSELDHRSRVEQGEPGCVSPRTGTAG